MSVKIDQASLLFDQVVHLYAQFNLCRVRLLKKSVNLGERLGHGGADNVTGPSQVVHVVSRVLAANCNGRRDRSRVGSNGRLSKRCPCGNDSLSFPRIPLLVPLYFSTEGAFGKPQNSMPMFY